MVKNVTFCLILQYYTVVIYDIPEENEPQASHGRPPNIIVHITDLWEIHTVGEELKQWYAIAQF